MHITRYRSFRNPPNWNANTPLADFDFFTDKLVAALRAEIACFLAHPIVLQSPPNRKTCKQLQVLVRRFERAMASGMDFVEWEVSKRDPLWWMIHTPVFALDFATVKCLACDHSYRANQCVTEEWTLGESLIAEGGRRLRCPCGHLLFTKLDWHS